MGDLIGSTEAARRLRVSTPTLERFVRKGEIRPAVKTDAGWKFYSSAEIDRVVELRQRASGKAAAANRA